MAVTATLTLTSDSGVENVIGGSGNDSITGNTRSNMLSGGSGNDTLTGGDGADVLIGSAGNDSLSGGAGNDTFRFDGSNNLGSDTVSESSDVDTLDFSTFGPNLTLNLATTTAQTVHSGHLVLTLSGVDLENVIGSPGNDSITGNSLPNALEGVLATTRSWRRRQ